ncbi:hypothetical protein E4U19_007339 [Claviceps sp. Clav32 group G5]|nr:hypothetical protein E4U19_007339 [Claviceps sp. Clav32 group G5]
MLGATPWLDRVREAFRLEAVEIGERPLAERPRSRKLQWSHSTCISGQEKKQQQQQQWRLATGDSRSVAAATGCLLSELEAVLMLLSLSSLESRVSTCRVPRQSVSGLRSDIRQWQ